MYGSVQGFDIRERFLNEARQLLDTDYGRRSLTTVQALLVLYTCYTGQGRDRGGLQYRHAAYEMLKRLHVKLEARFRNPGMADEAGRAKYQKAVSRALWGIYCFERYLIRSATNGLVHVKLTCCAPPTVSPHPHTCNPLWSERQRSQDGSSMTEASIQR